MQLPAQPGPETDPAKVLAEVIKEYHFHIYASYDLPTLPHPARPTS